MPIILLHRVKILLLENHFLANFYKVFSTKVFGFIFQIAAGVIIARYLGAEGKGQVAIVLSFIGVLGVFSDLGIPLSNVYYLNKGKDPNVLYTNTVVFWFSISMGAFLVALVVIPFVGDQYYPGIRKLVVYFSLIQLFISSYRLQALGFLRGFEKYTAYNLSAVVKSFAYVMLLLLGIYLDIFQVEYVIYVVVFSSLIAATYTHIKVLNHVKFRINLFSFHSLKSNVWYGVREYIGGLLNRLNFKLDILILASFFTPAVLGVYSVAEAILGMFDFVAESIGIILVPRLVREKKTDRARTIFKSSAMFLSLYFVGWLFFYFAGDFLIKSLYGAEFEQAYLFSNIMLVGGVFFGMTKLLNKMFSSSGRPEIKSYVRLLVLPLKLLFMYLFIVRYDIIGAAIAYSVTSFLLFIATFFFYQKFKHATK